MDFDKVLDESRYNIPSGKKLFPRQKHGEVFQHTAYPFNEQMHKLGSVAASKTLSCCFLCGGVLDTIRGFIPLDQSKQPRVNRAGKSRIHWYGLCEACSQK